MFALPSFSRCFMGWCSKEFISLNSICLLSFLLQGDFIESNQVQTVRSSSQGFFSAGTSDVTAVWKLDSIYSGYLMSTAPNNIEQTCQTLLIFELRPLAKGCQSK